MGEAERQSAEVFLWEPVEESFQDAEFLWWRWENGLRSHAYNLDTLSFWIEERLLGCLEGVRIGAEAAFEPLLAPALASDNPAQLVVAAHVAATGESAQACEVLLVMIGAASGERLAMLRRGVELSEDKTIRRAVEGRLAAGAVEHKGALLDLRSFHRQDPGVELAEVLRASEPRLRAKALRAVRYLPIGQAVPLIGRSLDESEPAPRNAVIESGLVLGSLDAWSRCLELVRREAKGVGPLLALVAMLGKEHDHEFLITSIGNQKLRRDALFALGYAGTKRAADVCVESMQDPKDARVAAESLCAITGLNLELEQMITRPDPEHPDEPIPFEQDDLDADLVPSADEYLPLPAVEPIRDWWQRNRNRFQDRVRYLAGREVTLPGLCDYLATGPLRRTHGIALEISVRTGGHVDLETSTFSGRQRARVAGLPATALQATGSAFQRMLSRVRAA